MVEDRARAWGESGVSQRLNFLHLRDIMISILETVMAQLLVRNLEDNVKKRLKQRAERHGRSLEEEVRDILRNAVKSENRPVEGLGTRIANRFKGMGLREGEEIQEWRGYTVRPAGFDK